MTDLASYLLAVVLGIRFFLVPWLIGRGWQSALTHSRFKLPTLSTPGSLALNWSMGALSLFFLANILEYILKPTTGLTFGQTWPVASNLVLAVSIVFNFLHLPRFKLDKTALTPWFLAIGITALVSGIWWWHSPWSLNWDLYEHQTLSWAILQGNWSLLTPKLSDTFGFISYPPLFHLLLATSQNQVTLTPQLILYHWQTLGAVQLLLVCLSSWFLGLAITGKKSVAAWSLIIGGLWFDSVIAFTNLFLLPQTLAALIWSLAMAELYQQWRDGKSMSKAVLATISLTLLSCHLIIGGLATAILLSTAIYQRTAGKWQKWNRRHVLTILLSLGMIGFSLFAGQLNLNWLNRGEGESYVFNPQVKIQYLNQMLGWSWLSFGLLGLLTAFFNRKKLPGFAFLTGLGLACLFAAQLPYMLKFMVLSRFWLVWLMALGIAGVITKLRPSWRIAAAGVILSTQIAILTLNIWQWKQGLVTSNLWSHTNVDEHLAASWLQDQTSTQSTLLVSDPATQYVLEGLSGVNSAGGVFASQTHRQMMAQTFLNPSQLDTSTLAQISDAVTPQPRRRWLVISGRLFDWLQATPDQQASFDFNIWRPRELSLLEKQRLSGWLQQNPNLSIKYANPSLVIVEVTPPIQN